MVRGISLILAVMLLIMWLIGLSQQATGWLTWLDGFGALIGFAIAGGAIAKMSRRTGSGASIVLGLGLGVLWIIGLVEHREPWLIWWTLAIACAYVFLGIAGFSQGVHTRPGQMRPASP